MARRDRIVREEDGKEIPGLFHHAFIHNGGTYFLTEIKVYQDSMIDCWGLVTLEGFQEKVKQGWVVTSLPEGAEVSVSFLVRLKAMSVHAWIKEAEFIKEVIDDIELLNDRPTSDVRCLKAYENFQQTPTEETRQTLKETYEAMPEHNRRYVLGDMDVKDIPLRIIIYGEGELEKWSHRLVAREMGVEPLPTINVPTLPHKHQDQGK